MIPKHLKKGSKVIGYFSYTNAGHVCCDGDACVIAGSLEAMEGYVEELPSNNNEKNMIKKTRFSEIIEGLKQGGAYAFDGALPVSISKQKFFLKKLQFFILFFENP